MGGIAELEAQDGRIERSVDVASPLLFEWIALALGARIGRRDLVAQMNEDRALAEHLDNAAVGEEARFDNENAVRLGVESSVECDAEVLDERGVAEFVSKSLHRPAKVVLDEFAEVPEGQRRQGRDQSGYAIKAPAPVACQGNR